MLKWELADEHATTWQSNGLSTLQYSMCGRTEIPDKKCSIIKVDVQLNNHAMTDEKCAL